MSISFYGGVAPHVLDPALGIHSGNLPITLKVAAVDAEPIGARGAYSHCDGVADEVQINAAIALAAGLGHGVRVELTDGHYHVDDPVVLAPTIQLVGAGRASRLLLPVGFDVPVITAPAIDLPDVILRDFFIDGITNGGPGAMGGGNFGILLNQSQRLLIDNVHVEGTGADGINCSLAPAVAYMNILRGCHIRSCGSMGIYLTDGPFTVADCDVYGVGRDGINVGFSRFVIVNNEVNLSVGVAFGGTWIGRSVILANYFHDATNTGLSIAASGGCVVRDNTCINNTGDGMYLDGGCDDSIIEGNTCTNNGDLGIDLSDPDRCIVKGNTLRNNVNEGLWIDVGCVDTLAMGNDVDRVVNSGANSIVRHNTGWITENKGTGTIVNPATTAVIAHGLSVTPAAEDIIITLKEQATADPGQIWVDTIGAANFTVHCRNAPGASNLDFAWQAQVL